jgi:iron(III) transport system substrate-binding protein
MNRTTAVLLVLAVTAVAAFLVYPLLSVSAERDVVLYSSVDQDQFQPMVEAFEKETGTKVNAVGETEASRSVGITKRLELEREHPVADLFWGNEIMNTVALRDLGVFAPLPAGVAEAFPARWRDAKGTYVAFAGRARILLVNKKLLPDPKDWPKSIDDLLDPKWGGDGRRVSIAIPLTGTTYTHAVALLTRDPEKAQAFWKAVAARGSVDEKGAIKLVSGNGAVMTQVADAKNGVAWGVTDTDDARAAIVRGDPVEIVYPDQGEGKPGTVVIPNTIALVRGGGSPAKAARLLRWLVSRETVEKLAAGEIANIPLREDVKAPDYVKRPGRDFRAMEIDWDAVGSKRDQWHSVLAALFTSR